MSLTGARNEPAIAIRRDRRFDLRYLRWSVMALYVALTLVWTNRLGAESGSTGRQVVDAIGRVPINREIIAAWIVGLLVVSVIGRPWREIPTILACWAPFLLSLYLYDFARSVGYRLERPVIVTPQLEIDKLIGLGTLPSEWLQSHLFDPDHIRWYDVVSSAIYMTHFIVPYAAAGVLWKVGKRMWRWYAASFVALNFSACTVFAVFATAPPWYAARQGLIDPFPRVIAGRGWSRIGLRFVTSTIDKGQQTVNPFAAIPSLHTAQASLVACFVAMLVPRRWRKVAWPLLALYPLGMGFVLVYSGEHYVIDVLTGWGFVAVILTAGWWYRLRTQTSSPFTDRRGVFRGWHQVLRLSPPADPSTAASGPDGFGGSRAASMLICSVNAHVRRPRPSEDLHEIHRAETVDAVLHDLDRET